MKFIELTQETGDRFLFDIQTGWEIHDRGETLSACWCNYEQARNLNAKETYEQVKAKLIAAGLMADDPLTAQKRKPEASAGA